MSFKRWITLGKADSTASPSCKPLSDLDLWVDAFLLEGSNCLFELGKIGAWLLPLCIPVWLSLSCISPKYKPEDLGPFFPMDTSNSSSDWQAGSDVLDDFLNLFDLPLCWQKQGDSLLLIAGQTFEVTLDNQYPGVVTTDITVRFYDFCGRQFGQATSDKTGTFSFQLWIQDQGFDGYGEYTQPGYPVFRQFDKRFQGQVVATKYRLVSKYILDTPVKILNQDPKLCFAQGSVYNLVSEETLSGVKIEARGCKVAYLEDPIPVPTYKLQSTKGRGVFFLVNCSPGPLVVKALLPDGRELTRPAIVWPLNSVPERVVTQIGIPVYPELDASFVNE